MTPDFHGWKGTVRYAVPNARCLQNEKRALPAQVPANASSARSRHASTAHNQPDCCSSLHYAPSHISIMLFKSYLFVHKTHLDRMNKDWAGGARGEENCSLICLLVASPKPQWLPLAAPLCTLGCRDVGCLCPIARPPRPPLRRAADK